MRYRSELRNLTEMVRGILEEKPETRSSDNLLYVEVLKKYTASTGKETLQLPVGMFFAHLTKWKIPSIETVGRCRRKAQQENPHLKATDEVQGFRYDKETDFIDFAVKG